MSFAWIGIGVCVMLALAGCGGTSSLDSQARFSSTATGRACRQMLVTFSAS